MQLLLPLIIGLFTFFPFPSLFAAEKETNELSVILLNDRAEPTTVFSAPTDPNSKKTLRFKCTLSEKVSEYRSWALEFSEPTQKLNSRISEQGSVPNVVQWDGVFTEKAKIEAGRRYFVRLLVIAKDDEILSSPWVSFEVAGPNLSEPQIVTDSQSVEVFMNPALGASVLTVKTQNHSSSQPTLSGRVGLTLGQRHSMLIAYEATSKALFKTPDSPTDVFYSDFSVGYRYWLFGAPRRARIRTGIPERGDFKIGTSESVEAIIQDAWTFQMGPQFYSRTLRGLGNQPVDGELARSYQGLLFVAEGGRQIGSFRLSLSADVGYSVLRGKTFVADAGAFLSYDRFTYAAPGLLVRYSMVSGKPADDLFDTGNNAQTSVTNNLLFAGLQVNFRL